MNYTDHKITLDIHDTVSQVYLSMKKGDSRRRLRVHLTEDGYPYHLSDDCYAVFTAQKPDGHVIFNHCTIDDCVVIYDVTEQTTVVPGLIYCEIQIYGANAGLLTSASFHIIVEDTVYDTETEIESTDEFSALTKLIGEAQVATAKANAAADKALIASKACMVIGTASGESILLEDAIDQYLMGCRVFAKTTQDGTPTPDAPVDLVSSVEGDHLTVHVSGKNLFTGWEEGGIASGDGSDSASDTMLRTGYLPIFASGHMIALSGIPDTLYNRAAFYDADKQYIDRSTAGNYAQRFFDPPENAKYFRVTIYESSATTGTIDEAETMAAKTMIELSSAYSEYEAGKTILSAEVSTPDGMHGIPVASGGNYIDASGQRWVSDEIDFARGVFIKRVGSVALNGSELWYYQETNKYFYMRILGRQEATNLLCDKLAHTPLTNTGTPGWWADNAENQFFAVTGIVSAGIATTLEEFKAYLAENPLSVQYILKEPVETPLSAEEIEAFGTLRTHRDYAMISNDAWAFMEIQYVMDAKKYIDSMLHKAAASRLTSVYLPASAWVGSNNLYSQVVAIEGITEYSQVNLTPSVEQLSIFYEKDITFVTENDGGVLTVYVIGQKPTNDYTIQADIVEVSA